MLDEFTVDIFISIFSNLTALIFTIISVKRKQLYSWAFASILIGLGSTIYLLRFQHSDFRLIANLFYALALIAFTISSIHFHRQLEQGRISDKMYLTFVFIPILVFFILNIPILVKLQFSLLSLVSLSSILSFHIFSIQRKPTQAFMLSTILTGVATIFLTILDYFEVIWVLEISYISNIILVTFLLGTALVSLFEDRLVKSEAQSRMLLRRAELYKDIFAHDMNNVLQNILSSIEILKNDCEKTETRDIIFDLVIRQINRGASLGFNVRTLSDLVDTKFQTTKIDLCLPIAKAVKKVKQDFNNINVFIDFNYPEDKYYIIADEFLTTAVINILRNSIIHNKNSKRDIKITISQENDVDTSDEFVKIEFSDNGVGITDEIKIELIQKTSDLFEYSRKGLGLPLILEIISRYNGMVRIEDRVKNDYSQGTNFLILLPKA